MFCEACNGCSFYFVASMVKNILGKAVFGSYCHPLLSLNPTICHPLNLMSKTWSCLPFYLPLPVFSVLPLSGLCYRPYGLSLTLCTKKRKKCLTPSLLITTTKRFLASKLLTISFQTTYDLPYDLSACLFFLNVS